jgi:hypothetical protein
VKLVTCSSLGRVAPLRPPRYSRRRYCFCSSHMLGTRTSRCLLFTHRRSLPFRHFSTSCIHLKNRTRDLPPDPKDKWNYNQTSLGAEPTYAQVAFKQVDSNMLEHETKPLTGIKMLARDFIEDSLYNPHYGYFPRQVNIFDTQGTSFEFWRLRDSTEFQEEVAKRYAAYGSDKHHGPGKQLWHTPTELFKVRTSDVLTMRGYDLIPRIAILWTCPRAMPCVRIPTEILPLRRLCHL